MSYKIRIAKPTVPFSKHTVEEKTVGGLQEARDEAAAFIQERMDAFGDDREALRQYGWYTAEAEALDMPEEGGTILLPDGWTITIINNSLKEE